MMMMKQQQELAMNEKKLPNDSNKVLIKERQSMIDISIVLECYKLP